VSNVESNAKALVNSKAIKRRFVLESGLGRMSFCIAALFDFGG
jgi:hypothetical protein